MKFTYRDTARPPSVVPLAPRKTLWCRLGLHECVYADDLPRRGPDVITVRMGTKLHLGLAGVPCDVCLDCGKVMIALSLFEGEYGFHVGFATPRKRWEMLNPGFWLPWPLVFFAVVFLLVLVYVVWRIFFSGLPL